MCSAVGWPPVTRPASGSQAFGRPAMAERRLLMGMNLLRISDCGLRIGRAGSWRMTLADQIRNPQSTISNALVTVLTIVSAAPLAAQPPEVLLATPPSPRDAGLLDSLLPIFERRSGFKVKVVAVGSGQALEMGRRGDADVVLAHAPEAERVLADSGYFLRRRLVMHNDFLVVGPAVDPAA